jgi:fibronectin type 3 domain-containing protein
MKKAFYILAVLALLFLCSTHASAESLSAPSFVSATVYGRGNIRVSWDNAVPGASRYTIQRKTDDGSFSTLMTLPSNVSTWNDTGITNGHTYTYRVFATGTSPTGDPTESYPVEYLYPSTLTPKGISASEIELSWTYPSSSSISDTNYQTVIERRTDGSSTWQTIATVPGSEDTWVDGGLAEATRYYYRIRTLTATSAIYLYYPNNTAGQQASTFLKAPGNVSARIISTNGIELAWEDASSRETAYLVERRKGYGVFTSLKTLGKDAESFTDNTAVNGEQYTYRITPLLSSFPGTPSEEITIPFLFPVSLEIRQTYTNQITLAWSYPGSGYLSADNSTVLIERRKAGNLLWEQIHACRPGDTEYTDNGLEPGALYHYRIRSRYTGGFITEYFPSSRGISGYTKLELDTYLYGYALSSIEIRLEWDEEAVGNNTVVLEKMGTTGTFEPLKSLTRTGFYIDRVNQGSFNTYRLKVVSSPVESDYTPAVDIIAEQLVPVANPIVKAIVPERVFLTWEYDKALESGFEVWRQPASTGIWELAGVVARGHLMYSDENVMNGETYSYRIRAVKSNTIFSPFMQIEPVLVSFSESQGDLVISKSGDMLYLGWDDFGSDIAGWSNSSKKDQYYIVEYKTTAYDVWHSMEKLPKSTMLYRFNPVQGFDYILRVRAFSESPVSERISGEVFYSTKIPASPSLQVPTITGSKRVVLAWADLSDNEDEFVLYRKNNNLDEAFERIGAVEADITTYADTSVLPEQSYAYQVRAKNSAGESFQSNEITVQTPPLTEFMDLQSHSWARDAIEELSAMGIVNGDGKGSYNPSGNVTRAEFIKILAATFYFPETPIGSFKDVTPEDWYHRWIMTAYRNGIVEPDENGLFRPDEPITRQDIVYFASRAVKAAGFDLEQPPLYVLYKFRDYDQIAGYAQSAFAAMNYAGVINGIGENKLGPINPATRAEAATMIHRLLKVLDNQARNQ